MKLYQDCTEVALWAAGSYLALSIQHISKNYFNVSVWCTGITCRCVVQQVVCKLLKTFSNGKQFLENFLFSWFFYMQHISLQSYE